MRRDLLWRGRWGRLLIGLLSSLGTLFARLRWVCLCRRGHLSFLLDCISSMLFNSVKSKLEHSLPPSIHLYPHAFSLQYALQSSNHRLNRPSHRGADHDLDLLGQWFILHQMLVQLRTLLMACCCQEWIVEMVVFGRIVFAFCMPDKDEFWWHVVLSAV